MGAVGEERDQVAEHVARGREAVQQQQLWRARHARFAIKYIFAVDLGGPIVDGGHDAFLSLKQREMTQLLPTSLIASRMMPTAADGAVTRGAWSTGCDRSRAFIRSAMKR